MLEKYLNEMTLSGKILSAAAVAFSLVMALAGYWTVVFLNLVILVGLFERITTNLKLKLIEKKCLSTDVCNRELMLEMYKLGHGHHARALVNRVREEIKSGKYRPPAGGMK
jgi:hypothetical protein